MLLVVTFAPLHNDKFLWYKTVERCCNRDTHTFCWFLWLLSHNLSRLLPSDFSWLHYYLFSFVYRTNTFLRFVFIMFSFPLFSIQQFMSEVPISFVFQTTSYTLTLCLITFWLIHFLSMHKTKFLLKLVNIGCIWKLCFGHSLRCVCPHFDWTTYKTKWRR